MRRSAQELEQAAAELRVVTSRLLRQLRTTARGRLDITPSQASVISRLNTDGPMSVADLARAEKVRPQSMRTTLATLEERDLVARSAHPTDQRQVIMSLTPESLRMLATAHAAKEDWFATALATKLTPAEQDSLIAAIPLLGRLVEP